MMNRLASTTWLLAGAFAIAACSGDDSPSNNNNGYPSGGQYPVATGGAIAPGAGGNYVPVGTGGTPGVVATGGTPPVVATGGTPPVVATGGTPPVVATGGTPPVVATGGTPPATGGTTSTGLLGGYHVHGDWAGFGFTFATDATITPAADVGFSAMVDQDGPYCASGSVQGTTDYHSIAAVGFNTKQLREEDAAVEKVVSTGTGLMVNISNPGGSPSLRVQIEDGTDPEDPDAANHRWCVNISDFDQDLVIPWESFNTECWSVETGTPFNPSTALAKVIIYLPDTGSMDQTFSFCVNDIGPDNVSGRGTGEIVPNCGTNVSWPQANAGGGDQFLTGDGRYGFQANNWNMGTGSHSMEMLPGGGFRMTSQSCSSADSAPCSFPSVYLGTRWGGNPTSNSGLPAQVSAIGSIPTCMGWSSGGTPASDEYNIAFDVWFSSNAGASTPEQYLMLWFRDPPSFQPAGQFPVADGIVIGDQIWSVWQGPNADGASVVSYAAPTPRADGQAYSFDLKNFIDDAVERGYIASSQYLISVMAGIEVWGGAQGASIDSFSCSVQ